MSDTPSATCPRCGSPIQAGNAENLCAACLMRQALAHAETQEMQPGKSSGENQTGSLPESTELPRDFGGYRLLRLLGRGGMGTVYEAEQMSTGRRVALKMLGPQLESADMRARFLREGRLAAGISHPNSLYVFGTEEIEGIPVITMELAGGGTLDDEVKKRGPLPVADAVDAMLGIITGLEAAQAAGVLHRDVKPSNVFVDPDGSVKVGDYGLSISTAATAQSFATATGVALGTPAYAAPEQLRGEELDVRADIYSVGATLFTLLTDRAPIEGKNPVQVVAGVLDQKPTSITALRRDVPAGLAQIVARCLAKKPAQRPADYGELRNALLTFSSETPQPAPPARRTLAYLLDELLSWFIPGAIVTSYYGATSHYGVDGTIELINVQPQNWPILVLVLAAWYIAYYTLPEGGWGAGLGKWLARIRVSRAGGRPPGHLRALSRTVIAWLARQGMIVFYLTLLLTGRNELSSPVASSIVSLVFGFGMMLAPLITMRRRNGFATLWDILTGTRVIEKSKGIDRATIDVGAQTEKIAEGAEFIGPYAIVEQMTPDWITGIDPALRRQVWLRRRSAGELDPARRNLARPGRSRWQQTIQTSDITWDVFEAQPGAPLASLLDREAHPHWESMRHWLYDLVIEIAQASEDGTLPDKLGLDHVWITGRGRAILLDEPWPRTKSPAECIDVRDAAGRQRFLDTVAQCAAPITIPLYARPVLKSLAAGSLDKLSSLAGHLRSLLDKPASLDSATRALSLFAIPIVVIALALFFSLITQPAAHRARAAALKAEYPGLPALNDVLRFRMSFAREARSHDFIDVHLAGHYDYAIFTNFADYRRYRLLTEPERFTLGQAIDPEPAFTPEALEEADRKLSEALPEFLQSEITQSAAHRARAAALKEEYPALPALNDVLRLRESLLKEAQTLAFIDVHLAGHYDYAVFTNFADYQRYRLLTEPERSILGQAIDPEPAFTPEALEEADRKLREALPDFLQGERQTTLLDVYNLLAEASVRLTFLMAAIQLVMLSLFRATAGQFLFGFAVVNAKGARAGRLRLLGRWLIAWAIPFVVVVSIAKYSTAPGPFFPELLLLLPWFLGLAVAVVRPARGLHDRLSGCLLVRR